MISVLQLSFHLCIFLFNANLQHQIKKFHSLFRSTLLIDIILVCCVSEEISRSAYFFLLGKLLQCSDAIKTPASRQDNLLMENQCPTNHSFDLVPVLKNNSSRLICKIFFPEFIMKYLVKY